MKQVISKLTIAGIETTPFFIKTVSYEHETHFCPKFENNYKQCRPQHEKHIYEHEPVQCIKQSAELSWPFLFVIDNFSENYCLITIANNKRKLLT